jgi:hypothetical protein
MTTGGAVGGRPPSWHQLLTGAHPAFPPSSSAARCAPRHGTGRSLGSSGAPVVAGVRDRRPARVDAPGDMGWADATAWSVVAGGVALVLAARVDDLLR